LIDASEARYTDTVYSWQTHFAIANGAEHWSNIMGLSNQHQQ